MREARARTQRTFADIRKDCKPARDRARKLFDAGRLDAAAAALDAALQDRRPIAYDGRNDFEAIGVLCDCFNLRGRICLAKGQLHLARAAFLDAIACGGRPYWEAVVDAVAASFLLEDVPAVVADAGAVELEDYGVSPGPILRRNFTTQQIDRIVQIASSTRLPEAHRTLAATVLRWASAVPEPLSP
jgi:hypothetical protein